MPWSYLIYAAGAVICYYSTSWLISVQRRVVGLEQVAEVIGNIRVRLLQVENRLALMEKGSKADPQTGVGSLAWLDSERWFAALRSTDPLCVAWFSLVDIEASSDSRFLTKWEATVQTFARVLRSKTRRGIDEVFRLNSSGSDFMVLLHGPLNPLSVAKEIGSALRHEGLKASGGMTYSTVIRQHQSDLRSLAEQGCKMARFRGGDCPINVLVDGKWVESDGNQLDVPT